MELRTARKTALLLSAGERANLAVPGVVCHPHLFQRPQGRCLFRFAGPTHHPSRP
jgi:hypothetical protein